MGRDDHDSDDTLPSVTPPSRRTREQELPAPRYSGMSLAEVERALGQMERRQLRHDAILRGGDDLDGGLVGAVGRLEHKIDTAIKALSEEMCDLATEVRTEREAMASTLANRKAEAERSLAAALSTANENAIRAAKTAFAWHPLAIALAVMTALAIIAGGFAIAVNVSDRRAQERRAAEFEFRGER